MPCQGNFNEKSIRCFYEKISKIVLPIIHTSTNCSTYTYFRKSSVQPVAKGQVSFNSPADVYQLSDVYSDTVSDSDSDGLLLKRCGLVIVITIQTFNIREPPAEKCYNLRKREREMFL